MHSMPSPASVFGGGERFMEHEAVGDDREVAALPGDARVAEPRLRLRTIQLLAHQAVGALVLEEDHGVRDRRSRL